MAGTLGVDGAVLRMAGGGALDASVDLPAVENGPLVIVRRRAVVTR
jgi:hypothetical protein